MKFQSQIRIALLWLIGLFGISLVGCKGYKHTELAMKDRNYWKKHYVQESAPSEIEESITLQSFISDNENYELVSFIQSKESPNVIISPGSGGHSYVFAELGYKIFRKGFNVFIMPKQGGYTIQQLMVRHKDALHFISSNYNSRIGIFGEGLGGYVCFYLGIAGVNFQSLVCQNSPAILTEKEFHKASLNDGELWSKSASKRKFLIPFGKVLVKVFPNMQLRISSYLDWKVLVDNDTINRKVELPLVEDGYLKDPDFDKKYPLRAIMSLIKTRPPDSLSHLKVSTMFVLDQKGPTPNYIRHLFQRLTMREKRLTEINGSVYWMLSHPSKEADILVEWFKKKI